MTVGEVWVQSNIMSYNNGGGTLHLPSPTHVHHVDVTSAVRSIRRSLSRSPSKFRLVSRKSPSPSPKSPLSPSPLSPSPTKRTGGGLFSTIPAHIPSPLAVPFPPSAKLTLRSARGTKNGHRTISKTRTSPRSPIKRALSETSDGGNCTLSSSSSASSSGGQENRRSGSLSPQDRPSLEGARDKSTMFNLEISAPTHPSHHALSRFTDGSNDFLNPGSNVSSPLKRSDAIMNLDQASLGSPVAKRRSLHGISNPGGGDFNVFDQGPIPSPHFDIHDDANQEYELSAATATTFTAGGTGSPVINNMPRRSSSLRKSTLQQRHGDKSSWGRRQALAALAAHVEQEDEASNEDSPSTPRPGERTSWDKRAPALAAQAAIYDHTTHGSKESGTPTGNKSRPRLSLDHFLPPMPRDSPFSSQVSLPNASVHVVNGNGHQPPRNQPHPLSRTITQSSSNSSIVEESPRHVPVNFGDQPRPKLDFSKSMPAGSLRPYQLDLVAREEGLHKSSSGSFATPDYKGAKPLPAAFMSTGLISKVNRNPEEQLGGGGKSFMPDTPCKRPSNIFATYPQPVPGSAIAKARHVRHSFGTPSTPFNPHGATPAPGTFGKGAGVFGSTFGRGGLGLTRRGSFLSIDGDDAIDSFSPEENSDSQFSLDFDLPPTPTKRASAPNSAMQPQSIDSSPSSVRDSSPLSSFGRVKNLPRTSSKLHLLISPEDRDADDSDASMDLNDSPTTTSAKFRLSSTFTSMPSFSQSRALRGGNSLPLAPLNAVENSLTTSSFLSPSGKKDFAKISHVSPASPLERIDFFERLVPRTPQDSMLPPDPSGLSISNHKDGNASKPATVGSSKFPPATPTSGRDYFPQFGDRRLSLTPVHSFSTVDVDDSLVSRFEKVELVGTGEFSQVYRVTQSPLPAPSPGFFNTSFSQSQGRTPSTPMAERVFAVKKARLPYQGNRDRLRKLQEVNVLKTLGQADHVIHYIDSWEVKNHLYIQTEFCEEGSLDMFLAQVGRKGRLDDFRIWKIMLELSQGLKHVHDSGFIHLDLKPANVFITFEGVLKIGDFGMAATWPAPSGIEGEGDREYIGPEILLGKYDKPADVFALGLIMLEIAGNVQLPDNGPTWQRLRSGDMSDVPSLTSDSGFSIARDATGLPIEDSDTSMESAMSDDEIDCDFGSPTVLSRKRHSMPSARSLSHNASNLFGSPTRGELHLAPSFMRDQHDENALDNIVRWMISPSPEDRPAIQKVLETEGVKWVNARRRAGATVFEGNWGPADDILSSDSEMMDV